MNLWPGWNHALVPAAIAALMVCASPVWASLDLEDRLLETIQQATTRIEENATRLGTSQGDDEALERQRRAEAALQRAQERLARGTYEAALRDAQEALAVGTIQLAVVLIEANAKLLDAGQADRNALEGHRDAQIALRRALHRLSSNNFEGAFDHAQEVERIFEEARTR